MRLFWLFCSTLRNDCMGIVAIELRDRKRTSYIRQHLSCDLRLSVIMHQGLPLWESKHANPEPMEVPYVCYCCIVRVCRTRLLLLRYWGHRGSIGLRGVPSFLAFLLHDL